MQQNFAINTFFKFSPNWSTVLFPKMSFLLYLLQTWKLYFLLYFGTIFMLFLPFSALLHKKLKKHVLTSVWSAQHPNASRNIQQASYGNLYLLSETWYLLIFWTIFICHWKSRQFLNGWTSLLKESITTNFPEIIYWFHTHCFSS